LATRKTLKSQVVIEYDNLLQALSKVQNEKKVNILEHFIKRAYASDNALFVLMHKLFANKDSKNLVLDQSKNIIINVVGVNGRNERSRLTSSTDAGVQSEETLLGTGSGS